MRAARRQRQGAADPRVSRVYFHSPSGDAELLGRERAWLSHLAAGPASAAWDLDTTNGFDRACFILDMAPEVADGEWGSNYLHTMLRTAREQELRNKAIYAGMKPGTPLGYGGANHEPTRQLVQALKTRLSVGGLNLVVCGVQLDTTDVALNTALAAGSDAVALAAKIHGWCESNAWVEGPDRAWLADVIELGLAAGLYRRGMGWDAPTTEFDRSAGVLALLRARDDEPVVLSDSYGDGFPNTSVGDWMPAWPAGVERDWNALTAEQQHEREAREEEWYELPNERRWEIGMAGLRADRAWARLSAETLRTVTFHLPVSVYDLLASDRDGRLRAVLVGHPDYREADHDAARA